MTTKRFKLIGDTNLEFLMQDKLELPIYDYANNNSKRLSLKTTLDLLNQLSEENDKLKEELEQCRAVIERFEQSLQVAYNETILTEQTRQSLEKISNLTGIKLNNIE